MMKSENGWHLKLVINNVVIQNTVNPQKKAVSSMFDIGAENATFVGLERLSPFQFDQFSVCFSNAVDADSIKVGVSIRREGAELTQELIFLNCRTRRIYTATKYFKYVRNERGEELLRLGLVQRFLNRFLMLPSGVDRRVRRADSCAKIHQKSTI